MNEIHITTHDHIGDAVILAGAVANVLAEHPEIRFRYSGAAPEVFQGIPEVSIGDAQEKPIMVGYGTVADERTAANGNLVEGFTKDLCRKAGIPMVAISRRTPFLVLSEEERERGAAFSDAILVNANAQTCTQTKNYPYWQAVVRGLLWDGARVVQIGSAERRNITRDLHGAEDMRGRTSVREYIAMVASCRCVLTPPSSAMNIAAAFGTPCVVVNGAREPAMLSDGYPNQIHAEQPSCGYDGWSSGCMALRTEDIGDRVCQAPVMREGCECPKCMADLHPLRVVSAAKRIMREIPLA